MDYTLPLSSESVSRKVNMEPSLFLGGGRALMMQVAHPSVADGVARYSDYRADPWNRFFRTMDVMFKLSFGTPEQSQKQARILAARHRRVKGTDETGAAYHALDPQLLLWVWATLADTSLKVYERIFGALTPAEREQFYQEQIAVAVGCGTPREVIPNSWDEFQTYIDRVVAQDLVVTPAAMDVRLASMVPPLMTPMRQLAAPINIAVTSTLLPASLRAPFDLPDNEATERLASMVFALAKSGRLIPAPIRQIPSQIQLRRSKPLRVISVGGAPLGSRNLAKRPTVAN
jgi:uncharacterized protein (DUF2236 family)